MDGKWIRTPKRCECNKYIPIIMDCGYCGNVDLNNIEIVCHLHPKEINVPKCSRCDGPLN